MGFSLTTILNEIMYKGGEMRIIAVYFNLQDDTLVFQSAHVEINLLSFPIEITMWIMGHDEKLKTHTKVFPKLCNEGKFNFNFKSFHIEGVNSKTS